MSGSSSGLADACDQATLANVLRVTLGHGRSLGWLFGWLVGRLLGWLLGRRVGRLLGWYLYVPTAVYCKEGDRGDARRDTNL